MNDDILRKWIYKHVFISWLKGILKWIKSKITLQKMKCVNKVNNASNDVTFFEENSYYLNIRKIWIQIKQISKSLYVYL